MSEEIRGLDLKILSRLMGTLKPYRWQVVTSVVALGMGALSELAVPLLLQNGIDKGLLAHDLAHLTLVSAGILASIVVTMMTSFYQVYMLSKISQSVMLDLRTSLMARFQRQSSAWLLSHPQGRLVSAVTSDVSTLSEFFNTLFTSLLKDFVMMGGVVVALFVLHPLLAFWTVVTLPPVFVLVLLFGSWNRKANRRVRAQVSRVNAFLSEHLQGIGVVQLFGRQKAARATFSQENTELLAANLAERTINAVFRPLIDVLWAVSLGFLVWFGTQLFLHPDSSGILTVGVLIAFITLVSRFYNPVASLAENFTALQSAMAGAERVFHFLETEVMVPDRGHLALGEAPHANIEFREVRFRYLPEEPVLQGLTFKVLEGQTVALVGTTGAGKTTITSLLTRLWDIDSGAILFGGNDLRDYQLSSLRGGIQSVLQDVFLFSGTVFDNIDLGRGLPRGRIEEVCRQVQAHGFIQALPLGYDTLLNEGATNLSSGQRQLVSFARVLAQDPKVLILDEATANIDTETEGMIQQALQVLLKDRTSLVIAHRLSTIRKADRILVLDRGIIAQSGTHEELLAQGGLYADVYKLQFESSSD